MSNKELFSHKVNVFHGRYLPEREVCLVGYSAIIQSYALSVPVPDFLCFISAKHKRYTKEGWRAFTPRHQPQASLLGHLSFAMKYEGIDLAVLKSLFNNIDPDEILSIVKQQPNGVYGRRLWFLYEWLQGDLLNLPDQAKGQYVPILDEALQYTGSERRSKRHRVINNFPGVPGFCPLIRKTEKLDQFINMKLGEQAKQLFGDIHADMLSRAAGFLLLKDSRASYKIENETPPQSRAERWGKAIGQAGRHHLSEEELCRLQEIVIGEDHRFIHLGLRSNGGYIGEFDRVTQLPIPEHISARWQDLESLINSLIETSDLLMEGSIDAVLAATLIAFGFVFIHPFEDGNGRIHRYLFHHMLAQLHFSDKGIVFPISAVIYDHIAEYEAVLKSFSEPRLEFIDWHPTQDGNVEVVNDTIDLYRYFDATRQAEFLYSCVEETVKKTLPEEIKYLQRYDEMKNFIVNYIEMPNRTVDLLINFLKQGGGKLSNRAKEKEFRALTDREIERLESKFIEIFKS